MESKYQIAFAEYLETLSESDRKFAKKNYCGAIKFGDKFLLLDKKSIKTEFWFSDEGNGFKNFCKVTATDKDRADYFIAENLHKYDVDSLHSDYCTPRLYVSQHSENVLEYYYIKGLGKDYIKGVTREMTVDEIREYDNGLIFAKAEHEKRMNTYLKRHGVSKLRFSTYYADI